MAGRGWGKTRTGAEWLARKALTSPQTEWAVIARTTADCRKTCLEGESGLLQALGLRRESPNYNRTTGEIHLNTGTVIYAFSADQPDAIRGPNLSGAWCDEIGTWRYEQTWTEALMFAVRKGKQPQIAATTTPRRTKLLRDLISREGDTVAVTRGSTFENAEHLSPAFIAGIKARYEGTRLGRQELYGELLEDVPGALWTAEMIDRARATLAA